MDLQRRINYIIQAWLPYGQCATTLLFEKRAGLYTGKRSPQNGQTSTNLSTQTLTKKGFPLVATERSSNERVKHSCLLITETAKKSPPGHPIGRAATGLVYEKSSKID